MRLLEQPNGFLKDRTSTQKREGNLVQVVPDLNRVNRAGPTVKKTVVVAENGGACGQHEQGRHHNHPHGFVLRQGWQMDVFQSCERHPRDQGDEPKQRVFEQFKSVSKQVVSDGEKREGGHGQQHPDEKPCSRHILATLHKMDDAPCAEQQRKNLQGGCHHKTGVRDPWGVQSCRGEVLLKLGESVATHPKEVGTTNDLVDHVEEPKQGPVHKDAKFEPMRARLGRRGVCHDMQGTQSRPTAQICLPLVSLETWTFSMPPVECVSSPAWSLIKFRTFAFGGGWGSKTCTWSCMRATKNAVRTSMRPKAKSRKSTFAKFTTIPTQAS